MGERRDFAVFSIPAHQSFADALVEGLLARFGSAPEQLARGMVLVPNSRAAEAIRDAFVRKSENGLLLPRIVPIGDMELGEHLPMALETDGGIASLPAINVLQRQFLLARWLADHEDQLINTPCQAMHLAAELSRVIDQLTLQGKTVADLKAPDEAGLSEHWQEALDILRKAGKAWLEMLKKLQKADPAKRQNEALEGLAAHWRKTPPQGFVIAAGISVTAPVIASFLRVVAQIPQGFVVLAGLDRDLPEDAWHGLLGKDGQGALEVHPQFHLRLLLDRIGIERTLVGEWASKSGHSSRPSRAAAISRAMSPAAFTQGWTELSEDLRTLNGVAALELAKPADEAQAIALAIRHEVEAKERRIALVTADRSLAKRVSAHLRRWGIVADDSAGEPLSQTRVGAFLLGLIDVVAEQCAPAVLLAMLKHPLCAQGEARMGWLDQVRALDLALRGPRADPGLIAIAALLDSEELIAGWWEAVTGWLAPLFAHDSSRVGIEVWATSLAECAQQFCGEQIWSDVDGRAAAHLIEQLQDFGKDGPGDLAARDFADVLRLLMDGVAVRPPQGGHPRIAIWGLLEAKLQSTDFVILGGLNEGVWPQLPSPDPWLAPAIRRELGMPCLEYRIGLTAHDLVSAMSAERVLLTRAKRDDKAPTTPSRFWLRLETLARGLSLPKTRYDLLARALDFAEGKRAHRPAPQPPVKDRPRVISVTEVDGLKADPYQFYARRVLGLNALQAPGAEPDASWRGSFLHAVLADWGQKDGFVPEGLVPRLRRAFEESSLHPVLRAFWLPRFEQAAVFFAEQIVELRDEKRTPLACEISGKLEWNGITLKGRADRIDQLAGGSFAIVDYKTGAPPSKKEIEGGFASQLGLLGAVLEAEGFARFKGKVSRFEYWSQARKSGARYGYVTCIEADTGQALRAFHAIAEHWLLGDAPFKAKLQPDYAYAEFDHLMRYEEWRGRDD